METGILARIIGKKSKKGGTDLEAALSAIVGLEQKYTAAVATRDAIKARLQDAIEGDILAGEEANHGALSAELATAQARVTAAAKLVHAARKEAMALINTGREARKDRIAELQAEVERINRAQTRRRVEATAAFCREWSLEVKKWPTEIHEGVISFPAIGELPETEVTEIFAKTAESPPAVDPAQGGLGALRAELERETLMDFYDPATALSGLLATARRAAA